MSAPPLLSLMHYRDLPLPLRRWPCIAPLALLTVLLLPGNARAQAVVTAEAGLDRYYKSQRWLPVQVTLTNQGAPARVEVRARMTDTGQGVHEYRIPEKELP